MRYLHLIVTIYIFIISNSAISNRSNQIRRDITQNLRQDFIYLHRL